MYPANGHSVGELGPMTLKYKPDMATDEEESDEELSHFNIAPISLR